MKNNPLKLTLPLGLAIALGLSFLPSRSDAQGYSFLGFGQPRFHDPLGEKVFLIDQLADQMHMYYSWEVRFRPKCSISADLLKHMKRHTRLTDDLVKAYRGDCGKTFKSAACDVRENLTCIQNLRKRITVSDTVCALIRRSCPLSTYVHQNASLFRPFSVARRPGSNGGSCNTGRPVPPRNGNGHGPRHANPYNNNNHNNNNNGGFYYNSGWWNR